MIEDKLQRFIERTITSDSILDQDGLDEHKIRYSKLSYLKGVLFEKGSMIKSENFHHTANRIFIGAYSSIRHSGYMRENFFMGRHSGIGYRCTIGAGMHNFSGVSINSDTIMAKVSNYTDEELELLNISRDRIDVKEMNNKPVIIGNDVYLGDGVIVMPGVTIGHGSVVAANAVVTKDVEPYTIVGGIPAKPIRDRFPDKVKEQLLETKWWNVKLEVLKSLPIDNVFNFISAFNDIDPSDLDTIKTLEYDTIQLA